MNEFTVPHKHNYFTFGFLTLGLALRDSKILYYHVDKNSHTAKVTSYGYNCKLDAFMQNETMEYEQNRNFV